MIDDDLRRALHAVVELGEDVERQATETVGRWRPWIIREESLPSARNLAAYLALRRRDLRPLQAALMPWGLSSLGRLESRVEPTLAAVTATLAQLAGNGSDAAPPRPSAESFFEGERRLRRNTDQVFGREHQHRRVRIMVTLPAEAASDEALTRDLLLAGTDCFRINCAHDDVDTWARMVGNIRAGEAETGHSAMIGMDLAGQKPRTMEVLLPEPPRRLRMGDRSLLTPDVPVPSAAARCSLPTVLGQLVLGCTVTLDDGRVVTDLESLGPAGAVLQVVATRPKGDNLRPARGLNFPGTRLDLPVLTEKDLADLDFVAANADIVGFSFVQTPDDIALLQHELVGRLHGRPLPPLMAKIETAHAVQNLPELIVRATGRQPFAVMIARGDLAVEIGYRRPAEIQEEILWVCEAAHVPVVWATEVLERLTKSGTPTRAEVTDAAMAERAQECGRRGRSARGRSTWASRTTPSADRSAAAAAPASPGEAATRPGGPPRPSPAGSAGPRIAARRSAAQVPGKTVRTPPTADATWASEPPTPAALALANRRPARALASSISGEPLTTSTASNGSWRARSPTPSASE